MTSTAELTSPSSANTPAIDTLDNDYTLEHKYTRTDGRIYLSGVQALVRLPLMQRLRDQAAGLETAGFISGYRGSPLGGFDLELWRAKKHLADAQVKFVPGLNEDLGATMVWGTQQTNLSVSYTHLDVYKRQRPCRANQPSTAPGTLTGSGPCGGMSVMPCCWKYARVRACGERPEPL